MVFLFDMALAGLELMLGLLWLLFQYTWPVWVIVLVVGIIKALLAKDSNDYYESPEVSSSESRKSERYEHTDLYGRYRGCSSVNSSTMESMNEYGAGLTFSMRSGNTTEHYGPDGLQGFSTDRGDYVEHWNLDGYQGQSKKESDGSYTHYDKYGNLAGSSKKR